MITVIVIIAAVILISSAMSDWASAKDWERSEKNANIRHQELMDYEKSLHDDLKDDLSEIKSNQKKKLNSNFVNRKRYIRDCNGNILAEEILVSQGKDEYLDDDDLEYDSDEDY